MIIGRYVSFEFLHFVCIIILLYMRKAMSEIRALSPAYASFRHSHPANKLNLIVTLSSSCISHRCIHSLRDPSIIPQAPANRRRLPTPQSTPFRALLRLVLGTITVLVRVLDRGAKEGGEALSQRSAQRRHAHAEYAQVSFHDGPVICGDIVPCRILRLGVGKNALDAEAGHYQCATTVISIDKITRIQGRGRTKARP
jgi:hypothetical protein